MDSTESSQEVRTQRSSGLPWVLFFLTLGLAAAAVYFGYGLLQDERTQNATALSASEDAVGKLRELEAKLAGSEGALTALQAEKSALAADLAAKEQELAKLKLTYDSLNEKLTAEIQSGDIQLTQTGERIQVDLIDKILFDSGKAEISEKGKEVLSRLGSAIAGVENKLIQVSGHTDDSPIVKDLRDTFPSNWELSAARAVNVVRHLSEKGKVPSRRLAAAGYGQFQPVSSNRDHAGRARNRRIEILLMPVIDPKPSDVKATAAKGSSPGTVRPASGTAK
ncbi:MAG: OmpA family protein [Myxococcota bacterium]|nr:OmpA family protein [Myxococcota bacterium]